MKALDELRFGPQRTLNLRDGLPSTREAVRRAESWLREQQIRGSAEVLVITGRGNQSPGGVGAIREAVEKLLFSLRRRGVVHSHSAHNPGAFAVQLAPIRSLVDAPPRRRDRGARTPKSATIEGLSHETTLLLRDLAERSLEALGVVPTEARLEDEIQRHLSLIVPALPRVSDDLQGTLQAALRAAIAEYD